MIPSAVRSDGGQRAAVPRGVELQSNDRIIAPISPPETGRSVTAKLDGSALRELRREACPGNLRTCASGIRAHSPGVPEGCANGVLIRSVCAGDTGVFT